jgi:hypothetical protein
MYCFPVTIGQGTKKTGSMLENGLKLKKEKGCGNLDFKQQKEEKLNRMEVLEKEQLVLGRLMGYNTLEKLVLVNIKLILEVGKDL